MSDWKNLPLPQCDRGADLQARSFQALEAALLATTRLVLRKEDQPDGGVDRSLEVKLDGRYTNLRSCVQVKSTDSGETNRDGAISRSIEVSNVNCMLNGPSPLYILYVEPRGELRYAWLHDEIKRLDRDVPSWTQQSTVTLHFREMLTPSALECIADRIQREGTFCRENSERLLRAAPAETVVVEINPETLETTDSRQAFQILLSSGTALVVGGLPQIALRLCRLLAAPDAAHPRIHLVQAYANYALGRYQLALGHIAEAVLRNSELQSQDQHFLQSLQDACQFHTGHIDAEDYTRRQEAAAARATGVAKLGHRLERLRIIALGEMDAVIRETALREIREVAADIDASPEVPAALKLQGRLVLLLVEGQEIVASTTNMLWQLFTARTIGLPVEQHVEALSRQMRLSMEDWEARVQSLLSQASEGHYPLIAADARTNRVAVLFGHLLAMDLLLSAGSARSSPAPEQLQRALIQESEAAIAIYRRLDVLQNETRARLLMAEMIDFFGQRDRAREVILAAAAVAQTMGYRDLEGWARSMLDGGTQHARARAHIQRMAREDRDESFAALADADVPRFAQHMLQTFGLPADRQLVLERQVLAERQAAREKFAWCRHVELLEELSHRRSRETHFRTDPSRRCQCALHRHRSAIPSTDAAAVIQAFKQTFCETCRDRAPKERGNEESA